MRVLRKARYYPYAFRFFDSAHLQSGSSSAPGVSGVLRRRQYGSFFDPGGAECLT